MVLNETMHITPFSYKIGACEIFAKIVAPKTGEYLNLVKCKSALTLALLNFLFL